MANKLKIATAFLSSTALSACQSLPTDETGGTPPQPETTFTASSAPAQQTPAASQWNSLGKYFEIIFAATPDMHESWMSEKRQQELTNRYAQFQEKTGMDAVTACMPLNEALLIAKSNELENTLLLSPEQRIHIQLTRDLLNSPTGRAITNDVTGLDPLLCVENNSASLGSFHLKENIVAYQLKNDCHGFDMTGSILQSWPQYSSVFNTFSEEITHATQFNSWDVFFPTYDGNFRRDDEKMWNLSVEAHAKVIASVIAAENAANGRPEILHHFLASTNQVEAEMTKKVMEAYLHHGQDRIHQQPDLLAESFFTFFRHEGAMLGYTDQGSEYFQKMDPQNHNPIPMSQYIEAFGKIPGSEGNMLASSLYNKTQWNIVEMMPETPLKKWFRDSLIASSKEQGIPDLPTNNHEQMIMSSCVNTSEKNDTAPAPSAP